MKLILLITAVLLLLLGVCSARAQNDYPIPPGNPDDWGIPGRSEQLPEEKAPPSNAFSAPPPTGNEAAIAEPSAPAGEPQEEYTGTRDRGFGGIAGTGIDESGVSAAQQNTFRR